MAFDEGLAQRLREALGSHQGIAEKKMFGGLAFMSHGYMFLGVLGDVLMARVGSPTPPVLALWAWRENRRLGAQTEHRSLSSQMTRMTRRNVTGAHAST